MRRHENGALRPAWREQVMSDGLVYLDTDTGAETIPYWREAQYYSFTTEETELLAEAANTVFAMCVAAGDHILEHDLFDKLAIPAWAVPAIRDSWSEENFDRYAPSVYGRFDFRYGNAPALVAADPTLAVPKLLEFNADTPTSLLETAVVQWNWLLGNDAAQHRDQWNNVYDALVAAWVRNLTLYRKRTRRAGDLVHFLWSSQDGSGEDKYNVLCMADAAAAAGVRTKFLFIEDIRFRTYDDVLPDPLGGKAVKVGEFVDADGEVIRLAFKLYPWEDLATDTWGPSVLHNTLQHDGTTWIEPPYKLMWSNKGLLPILWELFGDDPVRSRYLLPAYFAGEEPLDFGSFAQKPLLGREGSNVTLVRDGQVVAERSGPYGRPGYIRQQLAELPNFAGVDGPHHPVLGVWMIDGEAAGLGIRESDGPITDNVSSFVPHLILDD